MMSFHPRPPLGYVDEKDTAIFLAVVAEHREHGRATVRRVAARAGVPLMTTHDRLQSLRDEGLVAWEDGKHGTLRPLLDLRERVDQ